MKQKLILLLTLFMTGILCVNAQVTIGSDENPHSAAVLDLQSSKKGLKLPSVVLNEDKTVFVLDPETDKATAKGMLVYNTSDDNVYVWTGAAWEHFSSATSDRGTGTIGALTCGSRTLAVETQVPVLSGNTYSIPFTGLTGGQIILKDGDMLGSTNYGLTVVANGDQTLMDETGNVSIKVVGASTMAGTFKLSFTVGGQTCSSAISVTSTTTSGIFGLLDCGTHVMNVIYGMAVSSGNTFVLPYEAKTGANIKLTTGQVLGSTVYGLTVVADGAQTISAVSGSIKVKVTGTPTFEGTFTLPYSIGGQSCSIKVTSVKLDCTARPSVNITSDIAPGSVKAGGTVILTANASGSGTLTYQWYKNGGAIEGETSRIYTVNNIIKSDEYSCKVTNNCGTTSGSWIVCPGYIAPGGVYYQSTSGYITATTLSSAASKFTAGGADLCIYKSDVVNNGNYVQNAATCYAAGYSGYRNMNLGEMNALRTKYNQLSALSDGKAEDMVSGAKYVASTLGSETTTAQVEFGSQTISYVVDYGLTNTLVWSGSYRERCVKSL